MIQFQLRCVLQQKIHIHRFMPMHYVQDSEETELREEISQGRFLESEVYKEKELIENPSIVYPECKMETMAFTCVD